jgi:hypothetical protein
MAATAQAQAEATKEAQRAGIAHAKAKGDEMAYKGRKPSYSRKQFESAQAKMSARTVRSSPRRPVAPRSSIRRPAAHGPPAARSGGEWRALACRARSVASPCGRRSTIRAVPCPSID